MTTKKKDYRVENCRDCPHVMRDVYRRKHCRDSMQEENTGLNHISGEGSHISFIPGKNCVLRLLNGVSDECEYWKKLSIEYLKK